MLDDQSQVVPLMPDGKPRSINSVLGTFTAPSPVQDQNIPYASERYDFRPIKYVLLKSPNIGNFMTSGSFGERAIIKKIPVTVSRGEMILDDTRSSLAVLSCPRMTLRRLEFQLTDGEGNQLDLQGQDDSFSLIFSLQQKE